ncbi:MAG: ABC transporter permease [Phocaeicola sp.]|nr:ABC transporter permease [Phocaeicola sp.]
MSDLLQEILGTVMRNKLRTVLTGLSVAWGIFILIVLLGAGNGLIHAFELNSGNVVMNSVKVYPGTTTKPWQGMQEGRNVELEQEDCRLTAVRFPDNIMEVGATVSQNAVDITYGKDHVSITLEGVMPSLVQIEGIKLVEGRFINQLDMRENRKVMVLHKKTVEMLFPRESALGKMIKVNGLAFKVVGIYDDQNFFSPSVYVPYNTLSLLYAKGNLVDNLMFTTRGLTDEKTNDRFEDDFRTMLAHRHQFDASDNGAVWIWNRFTQYLQQQQATSILHIAIWVIGIFTLISGIVGVSNIMLITVRERTHEFGIRKALGASPFSILRLIIAESVLITTFFGYVGMVAGILATEYMDRLFGQQTVDVGVFSATVFHNPTVDISVAIQATLTLIIAGTLAGFFPARKAVMIRPIEALRAD